MPKSTVFLGERWGEGVLDIREGQRCQNRPFFFGRVLDIREGQLS